MRETAGNAAGAKRIAGDAARTAQAAAGRKTKASDGSSTTKLSRTDDAGLFAAPAPAVGAGAGFSPFDDCYPWNGMTVEFADWNGQTAMGKGSCDSGSIISTGGTDSMTRHTG